MDKIWLKSYRPGVPAEIDLNEYTSLNDLLAQSCRKFRDLPAFSNLGTTITYADLDRLSRHFAAWLQSLGLGTGARVALMMPNLLQYPVALFGVLRAGMIVVNGNPLHRICPGGIVFLVQPLCPHSEMSVVCLRTGFSLEHGLGIFPMVHGPR